MFLKRNAMSFSCFLMLANPCMIRVVSWSHKPLDLFVPMFILKVTFPFYNMISFSYSNAKGVPSGGANPAAGAGAGAGAGALDALRQLPQVEAVQLLKERSH